MNGFVPPKAFGPHDHRHAAERRLVAVDAAPGRGDADRAAAVGALGERHAARRRRPPRCRPTSRRCSSSVSNGLRGRAEEVVVADAAEAHDRAVGLADQDRAGLLHALGEHAVGVDHESFSARTPPNVARPAGLEVEQVLHRGRHAVQRAELLAAHDRALGLLGALPRVVVALKMKALSLGLRSSMRSIDGVHHLDRRELRGAGCAPPFPSPSCTRDRLRAPSWSAPSGVVVYAPAIMGLAAARRQARRARHALSSATSRR